MCVNKMSQTVLLKSMIRLILGGNIFVSNEKMFCFVFVFLFVFVVVFFLLF